MNLLKKWRKNNNGNDDTRDALARRDAKHGREGGDAFLARMRGELDQTFERFWNDFGRNPWSALNSFDLPALKAWPAVDVAEDERAVTVRADVPGLDERDLDVQVSGNLLTIRGSREEAHEDKARRQHERLTGSFVRTLTLPAYVDPAAVEARYDKGVLTVTVPKIPGRGPKRVKVSA